MYMQEICLQTHGANKLAKSIEPFRSAPEYAVEQHDTGDGKRNVEHPFHEEREFAMANLFQIQTSAKRHQEYRQ
jgi:hypothetical protein